MKDIQQLIRLEFELIGLRKRCMTAMLGEMSTVHQGQIVLLDLLEKNGTCSQIELARMLRVSPASIAVSLRRMERVGVVRRKPVPGNLRANSVELTDLGLQYAKRAREILHLTVQNMLTGFSHEEFEQLLSLSSRMCGNLRQFSSTLNETEESL